ncbi:MAG: alpha/beta hydrolase-fold protein [Planctomycetota bacterium]
MNLLSLCLLATVPSMQEPAAPSDPPVAEVEQEASRSLEQRLQEAAWLPTAKERAAAVKLLLRDRDVKTQHWLDAIRSYALYPTASVGQEDLIVKLEIDGKQVDSALHLYLPASYDPATPTPLLLLLHGSGGNGPDLLRGWIPFASEHGFLLLAPTDPDSDQGYAFTPRERDLGMAALRWVRTRYHVDPDRTHIFGVSRGGHMAWDLGTRYPDHFASVNPAIGGPTWVINGGRNNLRLVENLHRMPMRDLQGSQDDPRLLRNLHLAFARLKAVGNTKALLLEFPDLGHSYRLDTVQWPDYFDSAVRDPHPSHILYRTARTEEVRRAWLLVDRLAKSVDEDFPIKVDPKEWQRLDDTGRAAFIQDLAEERTAKIEARRLEDGSFKIETEGITRLKLRLPESWIPEDGKITVSLNGKSKSHRVKLSKRILLLDFVERFDRSSVSVASVDLKP